MISSSEINKIETDMLRYNEEMEFATKEYRNKEIKKYFQTLRQREALQNRLTPIDKRD